MKGDYLSNMYFYVMSSSTFEIKILKVFIFESGGKILTYTSIHKCDDKHKLLNNFLRFQLLVHCHLLWSSVWLSGGSSPR